MADLAMENSTINVDPSGDLTLLVGDPDKEAQQSFLVSSKAMQLASPVWATLFDPQGRFLEANAKEVSLPDDDPHALLILLHIAHLNFDLVSAPCGFRRLLQIAVLCDKYDTVKLVRPWLGSWLETTPEKYCKPGFEEWLFVAWTFGLVTVYETLSRYLLLCITVNPGDVSGRLLNRARRPLGDIMPPGALDYIASERRMAINRLLALCQALSDRYTSERVCQASEPNFYESEQRAIQSRECDALVLGSLIKELSQVGLWPIPEAADVGMSLSTLRAKLLGMICYQKGVDGFPNHPAHEKCVYTIALKEDVQRVFDTLPKGVTVTDREHMHVQAQKAGK